MEMQTTINLVTAELEKAIATHKKYGTAYAVVRNEYGNGPTLYWGHAFVGYAFTVERVYRHNGADKDGSIRIIVSDYHENGWRNDIYEDKFKVSLTEKTILKKIQNAVAFINALPEKNKDRIHGYAGVIGRVANNVYYDLLVSKGGDALDNQCRITNKIEMAMEYADFHSIYGGSLQGAVGNPQNVKECALARQLSEMTGITSTFLK